MPLDDLSADDLLVLRIAKSRGLTARPGTTPGADELRHAFEAYEAVMADALTIIRIMVPDMAAGEFCRRADNLREYARILRDRI